MSGEARIEATENFGLLLGRGGVPQGQICTRKPEAWQRGILIERDRALEVGDRVHRPAEFDQCYPEVREGAHVSRVLSDNQLQVWNRLPGLSLLDEGFTQIGPRVNIPGVL